MPVLTYDPKSEHYIFAGGEPAEAFKNGLTHAHGRIWITKDMYCAYGLRKHVAQPVPYFSTISANIRSSGADHGPGEAVLMPFQRAGVNHMHTMIIKGGRYQLLADEQGLGKTIQSIYVANRLGIKRLLVVCPASLRINWVRELESHFHEPIIEPVFSGRQSIKGDGVVIVSYDLLKSRPLRTYRPEMMIYDECHYLKSPSAQRTRTVFGPDHGWLARYPEAPALFLTGTPEPNGRPTEIYNILRRCAYKAISNMSAQSFINRYCVTTADNSAVISAKNKREFYVRLRGSGFMVRRLKKNVLKDLPPISYKLVVFPSDSATEKVIEKESQFDASEIEKHGIPVGSGLPALRREMGEALAPRAAEYVNNILSQQAKVIVFCHHRGVMDILRGKIAAKSVMLWGGVGPKAKQKAVDAFQNDPDTRVFIGNEAAEEGLNLTASSDVILVEPEWVPGKNEQRGARAHRIGQKNAVLVHLLVVERSLGARILGSAYRKFADARKTLDNE